MTSNFCWAVQWEVMSEMNFARLFIGSMTAYPEQILAALAVKNRSCFDKRTEVQICADVKSTARNLRRLFEIWAGCQNDSNFVNEAPKTGKIHSTQKGLASRTNIFWIYFLRKKRKIAWNASLKILLINKKQQTSFQFVVRIILKTDTTETINRAS